MLMKNYRNVPVTSASLSCYYLSAFARVVVMRSMIGPAQVMLLGYLLLVILIPTPIINNVGYRGQSYVNKKTLHEFYTVY